MKFELIPLTGLGRYPGNNEFLERHKNRRADKFAPATPLGYDRTKMIEIDNGIGRKIPGIQTTFRFWVRNDDKKFLTTGLTKLDIGIKFRFLPVKNFL